MKGSNEMRDSSEKRGNFELWKGIFLYLKEYKSKFLKMVLSNVLLSFSLVIDPMIVAFAIDHFIKPKYADGLYFVGALSLILAISLSVLVYYFCRIGFGIEGGVAYRFRKDMFEKLHVLAIAYFDRTPVGAVISRMGSDTNRVAEVVAWGILDFTWAGGYIIMVSIAMLIANVKLALVVLALMPILAAIAWAISVKVLKLQREVRSVNSRMTSAISDGIYGAKTSKTLCREETNCREFSEITGEYRRKTILSAVFSSAYTPTPMALSSLGVGLVLLLGGEMAKNGEISIGTVSLFVSYANMIFDPIVQMMDIISNLVKAHAAAERVMELVEMEPAVIALPEFSGGFEADRPQGEIAFQNVSFFYKEGEYILKDFNLKVEKGTTVALVGRTGAGKTTIVNLACRFYEPTEGRILIDGVDYRMRSHAWLHRNLGYVLQSPFLFTGTIAENIRYGKMDATDEEVEAAARLVRAHEFIEQFEKGYETQVGEGGSLLSGGQKQLISFARAVLRSPQIFVLDEATSSVDTQTEQLLRSALEKLLKDRTSFVVAHRLSTVKNADVILVIEDGEIAEQGRHEELMARRGMYYQLYTNQKYEEDSSKLLRTESF